MSRQIPLENRFWEKVAKCGPDECWEWQGSRQPRGYGRVNRNLYGEELVHRIMWAMAYGPIPDGLIICHHCDNPPCCNPNHLFLGDQSANMTDMWRKGRGPRDCWPLGEDCQASKLTTSDVREIRERYAKGGITHKELGAIFRVSPANIGLIIQRRIWKHVE